MWQAQGGTPWVCSHSRLLDVLHDKRLVDVGNDTTTGDGGLDQGVELFITTDSQLQVAGSDPLHLQVFAGVSGELKNLSGEVFEDSRSIHGRGCADARLG